MCFLFYRILVQSTPAFLPGEFRGRGAWRATGHGVAELDPTERRSLRFTGAVQTQGKLAKRGSWRPQSFAAVQAVSQLQGPDGEMRGPPKGALLNLRRFLNFPTTA